MKKLIFVIVLIIANFSCKDNSQSQQIAEVPYDQNGLNSAIENTIQKYLDLNIFSGIVLVAEEGELMYHKAFGLADRALNQPNTLNTLFDIGSMNKT
ncbi:MAG: beta-lactamase family protein, partial [Bacteroidia bacterium]|nr:beta-lactamase family protein [Bacteroidia bacterium]